MRPANLLAVCIRCDTPIEGEGELVRVGIAETVGYWVNYHRRCRPSDTGLDHEPCRMRAAPGSGSGAAPATTIDER